MFTTAVILACLIEIVHIPPAEPLPVGLAHNDIIHDYGFRDSEDETTHHIRDEKRDNVSGFVRIMLMLLTSACYIASVRTRNIRNKLLLILAGATLSFGILLS